MGPAVSFAVGHRARRDVAHAESIMVRQHWRQTS
jgi:hypothetical protein